MTLARMGDLLLGAWEAIKGAFGNEAVGNAVQRCPLQDMSMPDEIPASCSQAPSEIHLPPAVNDALVNGFKKSFPNGISQEQGGTIIKDAAGKIRVINEKGGTSGTFSPDRTTGPGEKVIGIFHTHPYDEAEGGHQGVSFSAADISIAISGGEPDYVDAGSHQFAIVPTGETPNVSHSDVQRDWEKLFAEAGRQGMAFEEASRAAALGLARKYKMAYYEGSNGELKKLSC